jgi:hypothetical protein
VSNLFLICELHFQLPLDPPLYAFHWLPCLRASLLDKTLLNDFYLCLTFEKVIAMLHCLVSLHHVMG